MTDIKKVEPFLLERLNGQYPVGPIIDGEPEMGWRKISPVPRISLEAAMEIKELRKIKDAAEEWIRTLTEDHKGLFRDGIPGDLMQALDDYKSIQLGEYPVPM